MGAGLVRRANSAGKYKTKLSNQQAARCIAACDTGIHSLPRDLARVDIRLECDAAESLTG